MSFPPRFFTSPPPMSIKTNATARGVVHRDLVWHKAPMILRVRFMGGTVDQQNKVLEFAKPWSAAAKLEFEKSTAFDAEIRVSFNQQLGNWSYIGTDSIHGKLGYSNASMNLSTVDLTMVLHEFGHALGLGHEHQHPDAQVTLDEQRIINDMIKHPYNWSLEEVNLNILNRLTRAVVDTTPYDSLSIMAYPLPAAWLKAGKPLPRNTSLSSGDIKLVQDLYGKRAP